MIRYLLSFSLDKQIDISNSYNEEHGNNAISNAVMYSSICNTMSKPAVGDLGVRIHLALHQSTHGF